MNSISRIDNKINFAQGAREFNERFKHDTNALSAIFSSKLSYRNFLNSKISQYKIIHTVEIVSLEIDKKTKPLLEIHAKQEHWVYAGLIVLESLYKHWEKTAEIEKEYDQIKNELKIAENNLQQFDQSYIFPLMVVYA